MIRRMFMVVVGVLVAGSAWGQDTRTIKFEWDAPTEYVAVGGVCGDPGTPIPPGEVLEFPLQVFINGVAQPVVVPTGVTEYIYPTPLAVGTVVGATLGARKPGGAVMCVVDMVETTIQPYKPRPCGRFVSKQE